MGASPYTTIKLMRRYPCGPDYENSLYFANVVAQTNYMDTLVFKTFTNQSFQRPSRGRIRLQVAFTDSETVNYLAWNGKKNPNVASDVWYYAFVTGVKYINEAVTEFVYELDVIQTYWFLTTLKRCLVERETVADDTLYKNLIDEGIDIQDYYESAKYGSPVSVNDLVMIVAATFNTDFVDSVAGRFNGLFTGLCYNMFDLTDTGIQSAKDFVTMAAAKNKSDGIVSIFYAPRFLFTVGGNLQQINHSVPKDTSIKRSNGASVHNNKLKAYPFSYLLVVNNAGDSVPYKYEYFYDDDNCTFGIRGDSTCSPGLIMYPTAYNGYGEYETIGLTGFPMCSYTNDAFKAWLAQNTSGFIGGASKTAANTVRALQATADARALQATANAMHTARANAWIAGSITNETYMQAGATAASMDASAGAAASGAVAAGAVALVSAAALVGTVAAALQRPNMAYGVGSSATLFSAGLLQFNFIARRVNPKLIDQIDDYFDMFGYKVATVKIPDTHSRPHWNYVKTVNCQLTGYCANGVSEKIKVIFNGGIRFWRNGAEVGQYNLDNRPVSAQVADGTMSVEEAQAYEA